MSALPDQTTTLTLDQLLSRDDIWQGNNNHFCHSDFVDTGHHDLNTLLRHNGWPLSALIEVCQQQFRGEWQLFLPSLLALNGGLIVLLNPPAEPFNQALIQAGVDLDRLIIVNAAEKNQFLNCFRELARTSSCSAILGWQPQDYLTYTELRKCLLASADGKGLYTLFRPAMVQQQSSPAQLRLFCQLVPAGLEITLFKQKGILQSHQPRPIVVPLPTSWQATEPYSQLDQPTQTATVKSNAKSSNQLRKTPAFTLRGNR